MLLLLVVLVPGIAFAGDGVDLALPSPVEPGTYALKARLDRVVTGDPSTEGVRMGPLVGRDQARSDQASPPSTRASPAVCIR